MPEKAANDFLMGLSLLLDWLELHVFQLQAAKKDMWLGPGPLCPRLASFLVTGHSPSLPSLQFLLLTPSSHYDHRLQILGLLVLRGVWSDKAQRDSGQGLGLRGHPKGSLFCEKIWLPPARPIFVP